MKRCRLPSLRPESLKPPIRRFTRPKIPGATGSRPAQYKTFIWHCLYVFLPHPALGGQDFFYGVVASGYHFPDPSIQHLLLYFVAVACNACA
ncbi:hypothetical protein KM92DES2_20218 [uncultured Desulfovibrio sp.]|uniref:Uncharacterized protein n=1 Tax=uncultured Desulfovibrio sp. TaxID=167968 RepID=A0A212KJP5_9BACT|nr:hypothetical protein KM92DES2_20218 [uncultured Desulfovibrio sp.]